MKNSNVGYIVLSITSTFFMFAMVRLAILIPELFKESTSILYDFDNRYVNDTHERRQIALISSDLGLANPFLIPILIYLLYGIVLFSIRRKNHEIYKVWVIILNISAILFGIIITAFSIWRA